MVKGWQRIAGNHGDLAMVIARLEDAAVVTVAMLGRNGYFCSVGCFRSMVVGITESGTLFASRTIGQPKASLAQMTLADKTAGY